MGFGAVFFYNLAAGAMLAFIATIVTAGLAAALTFGARAGDQARERARTILFAMLFPIACLGWVLAIFALQTVADDALLGQHVFSGAAPYAPLPNGYAIALSGRYQGTVYNPKTWTAPAAAPSPWSGLPAGQPDVIQHVRSLQVAGPLVVGRTGPDFGDIDIGPIADLDPGVFGVPRIPGVGFPRLPAVFGHYFVVDTRSGAHVDYATMSELENATTNLGSRIRLERITVAYGRYRTTWIDLLAVLLYGIPPFLVFCALAYRIARLRNARSPGREPLPLNSMLRIRRRRGVPGTGYRN